MVDDLLSISVIEDISLGFENLAEYIISIEYSGELSLTAFLGFFFKLILQLIAKEWIGEFFITPLLRPTTRADNYQRWFDKANPRFQIILLSPTVVRDLLLSSLSEHDQSKTSVILTFRSDSRLLGKLVVNAYEIMCLKLTMMIFELFKPK